MSDRRFTDREVALVLRRAAELETEGPKGVTAKGLSLEELREIAAEVGIDPNLVTRAVEEMESRGSLEPPAFFGPPAVRRETRAIQGELTTEQLRELIRAVDRAVPAPGTLTEALGSIRWNAHDRTSSTMVAVEPGDGETVLRVEEGYADHVRPICHVLPMLYGLFGGLVIPVDQGWGVAAAIIGSLLGTAVGYGLGDGIWRMISARSARRVKSLAANLAQEARRLLPSATGEADEEDDS